MVIKKPSLKLLTLWLCSLWVHSHQDLRAGQPLDRSYTISGMITEQYQGNTDFKAEYHFKATFDDEDYDVEISSEVMGLRENVVSNSAEDENRLIWTRLDHLGMGDQKFTKNQKLNIEIGKVYEGLFPEGLETVGQVVWLFWGNPDFVKSGERSGELKLSIFEDRGYPIEDVKVTAVKNAEGWISELKTYVPGIFIEKQADGSDQILRLKPPFDAGHDLSDYKVTEWMSFDGMEVPKIVEETRYVINAATSKLDIGSISTYEVTEITEAKTDLQNIPAPKIFDNELWVLDYRFKDKIQSGMIDYQINENQWLDRTSEMVQAQLMQEAPILTEPTWTFSKSLLIVLLISPIPWIAYKKLKQGK